jgi:hypothetical protein
MKLGDISGVQVDWKAAPQSALEPREAQPTTSSEQFEGEQRSLEERVGTGYLYIDCRNTWAILTLRHCTKPGYWEIERIEQDLISEGELVEAVQAAGGALNRSGCYPLTESMADRLRAFMGPFEGWDDT